MNRSIALLRGINVGGHRKVPMARLRKLAESIDLEEPETYIQSGNLVFRSAGDPRGTEARLEKAIEAEFGFQVPCVVRTAEQWAGYITGNPLREKGEEDSRLLMLALSTEPPTTEVAAQLEERGDRGEIVREAGDALWIFFAGGSARSRITPQLMDRLFGSSVTTRNWRTVLKIGTMLGVDE